MSPKPARRAVVAALAALSVAALGIFLTRRASRSPEPELSMPAAPLARVPAAESGRPADAGRRNYTNEELHALQEAEMRRMGITPLAKGAPPKPPATARAKRARVRARLEELVEKVSELQRSMPQARKNPQEISGETPTLLKDGKQAAP